MVGWLTTLMLMQVGVLPGPSVPRPRPPAAPTGPHPVSYRILRLADSSRRIDLAVPDRDRREFVVQVWYPSRSASPAEAGRYLPDSGLAGALVTDGGVSPATVSAWEGFRVGAAPGRSIAKAKRLPLVVLSHGLGSSRVLYTGIARDLASYGYAVAAIDHPYGGLVVLPGGRVQSASADSSPSGDAAALGMRVMEWAADAEFVVDRLLDPARSPFPELAAVASTSPVAMVGHSLGGAAALQACRGTRFTACVDLDGAPFGAVADSGVRSPSLVLLSLPVYSDADLARRGRTREQWDAMGDRIRVIWRDVAAKSGVGRLTAFRIRGTNHSSYSDVPLAMPEILAGFGGTYTAQERVHEITIDLIRAFLATYLTGSRSTDWRGAAKRYPEVVAVDLTS